MIPEPSGVNASGPETEASPEVICLGVPPCTASSTNSCVEPGSTYPAPSARYDSSSITRTGSAQSAPSGRSGRGAGDGLSAGTNTVIASTRPSGDHVSDPGERSGEAIVALSSVSR